MLSQVNVSERTCPKYDIRATNRVIASERTVQNSLLSSTCDYPSDRTNIVRLMYVHLRSLATSCRNPP